MRLKRAREVSSFGLSWMLLEVSLEVGLGESGFLNKLYMMFKNLYKNLKFLKVSFFSLFNEILRNIIKVITEK